jgi:hypothetical protein
MTTVATLDNTALTVAPGGEVRCTVKVRNGSEIVEAYRFQVVGDPGQWASVEPATVSLYPAAEGVAVVTFKVPRSSRMPAADFPFAVRVLPTERPQLATAAEGMLRVLPYRETGGEVIPRLSKAHRRARHEVAIDNKGNTPVALTISAADPDQALRTSVAPATVVVPPGQAVFSTVALRHQKLLWRGQPVTRPFRVILGAEGQPPQMIDATTVQTPLISRATARLALMALAGLAALALLWFLVLRPAVTSAAKDAVATPGVGGQAINGGSGAGAGGGGGGAKVGPSAAAGGGQTPFSQRLNTAVGAGGVADDKFTVAAKTTFLMTDLLLQNPQGDVGRVDVLINGQTVYTSSLANFRDLDYHLVTPIEALTGQTVSIHTTCVTPGPPLAGTTGSQCRVFALVVGMGIASP